LDTIRTLIHNIRIADFLDIAIIAVVLYFILTWVRRRASRSVVIGIALVILLYSLARMLNMYLTSQLFHAGLTAVLMALVLVFHEDIRMAIERISSWNTLHLRHLGIMSSQTIDTLVGSVSRLAKDKIGALIVIKGRDSLERHLNGGTTLNGTLSISLLYSLFHPQTPSHDGAAVIEGERIDSFGVRLPLSRNIHEVGDAGTRHTAALGLAERSDSFIIVVSEERGTISVAEQGKLIQVPSDVLHQRLLQFNRLHFGPAYR
jgi:diadenylate cyclase